MRTTVRVELPGGRGIALRPIGDEDDVFILDTADGVAPGTRATALVARCVVDGNGDAGALTAGDRDALLLHLRRISLGESMDCVLRCPAPGCGESLEWQVHVADLLVQSHDTGTTASPGSLSVDADGAHFDVTFQPPTLADIDRVSALAPVDVDRAALALFERCVRTAERDGRPCAPADLPPSVRAAIEAAMAAADPQADVQLTMRCPACDAPFSAPFDTAAFLLRELDARAARTLADVHTLAQHYHWSEADILGMTARRRAQYIALIRNTRPQGRAQ